MRSRSDFEGEPMSNFSRRKITHRYAAWPGTPELMPTSRSALHSRAGMVALTLRSASVGPSSAGPGRTLFGPTLPTWPGTPELMPTSRSALHSRRPRVSQVSQSPNLGTKLLYSSRRKREDEGTGWAVSEPHTVLPDTGVMTHFEFQSFKSSYIIYAVER